MRRKEFRFGTAIAVLAIAPSGAFAENSIDLSAAADAVLTGEQTLSGNRLELGDYQNTLSYSGDIATEASGMIGLNMVAGDYNLQNNTLVLALLADPAEGGVSASSSLLQTLEGSTALTTAQMHNAVTIDLTSSGAVAGNVGLNAASGAFNIQQNALSLASVPGSVLAQSVGGLAQNAEQNISIHHNAINDVAATIILDDVSGNVGINLASGVGNLQMNSVTIARPD